MKTIVSHLSLNANAKAVVHGLFSKNILYKVYTTIAVFPNTLLFFLAKLSFLSDFNRRKLPDNWEPYTKYKPFYELGRLLASKLKIGSLVEHEKGYFSVDRVYHRHDVWVSKNLKRNKKKGLEAVYAYEDGALTSFEMAKKLDLYCIYDLPIGYWKSARALMENEYEKNAEWSSTLTGFKDSSEKLKRKDKELELSDVIFVASTFTKKTLEMYDGKLPDIHVIPYGFPDIGPEKKYIPLKDRKLKVLFVGGLSQRKGLSYLFDAITSLENNIELTVVGRKPVQDCVALNRSLEKHNWIPSLPHNEILECMREHDVLVFPSLFEGFGLVITEAMSQGTPVITTNRTAGPDIIEHGVDGWIVEPGSSKAIINTFNDILNSPETLKNIGLAAQVKAKSRPWEKYSIELAEKIGEFEYSKQ